MHLYIHVYTHVYTHVYMYIWLHEPLGPTTLRIERVFKNSNSPNSDVQPAGSGNAKIPTAPDQKQKNQN